MRKNVIAGNWKMNKLPNEAIDFIIELEPLVKNTENEVVICVPYTDLFYCLMHAQGTNIKIGAQNMNAEEKGAYTGEVSAAMIASAGCEYTILGHSERRQYYGETDSILVDKVNLALANGLGVIFCVGENLEQREAGKHFEVVTDQIKNVLFGLSTEQMSKIIVAYEPVWAIGTGKTATAEQAQEIHACIRKVLADKFGAQVADDTTILYGGSCKPSNAKELFACPDIDGGLIGGAALKADDFIQIAMSF